MKKIKTLKSKIKAKIDNYIRFRKSYRDWKDSQPEKDPNPNIPLVLAVVTLLLTFRNEITWLIRQIFS